MVSLGPSGIATSANLPASWTDEPAEFGPVLEGILSAVIGETAPDAHPTDSEVTVDDAVEREIGQYQDAVEVKVRDAQIASLSTSPIDLPVGQGHEPANAAVPSNVGEALATATPTSISVPMPRTANNVSAPFSVDRPIVRYDALSPEPTGSPAESKTELTAALPDRLRFAVTSRGLGLVDVTVATTPSSIAVSFVSTSEPQRGVLETAQPQLIETLRAQGVATVTCSVSTGLADGRQQSSKTPADPLIEAAADTRDDRPTRITAPRGRFA